MALSYGEVAVPQADAIVLSGGAAQQSLLLSNPGPVAVYVAFGRPAVVGQSILIPTGVAPILFSNTNFPGLMGVDLHAVAAGAGGRLAGVVQS